MKLSETPPASSSISLSDLSVLMKDLQISEMGLCKPDLYLVQPQINQIFQMFLKELASLQNACKGGEGMVEMTLRMFFNGLLDAIRTPYTETIAVMSIVATTNAEQLSQLEAGKVEISRLQTELSRLQTELSRLQTELSWLQVESSRLQVENEISKSQNRSLEISNARMEEKLASKTADVTRLRNERNQLRSDSSNNTAIQKDNQQEVSRLRYQMEELAQAKHDLMMASIGSGSSGRDSDTFNATSTRTELWNSVLADPGTAINQVLPFIPLDRRVSEDFAGLVGTDYPNEPAMYDPIREALGPHLDTIHTESHPGSHLWLTNYKRNLQSLSPDFSIAVADIASPDSSSIIALWEVKHLALARADYGQLYNYLRVLGINQPYRRDFLGVLSNLRENIVMYYRSPQGKRGYQGYQPTACKVYGTVSLAYAVSYLREMVIADTSYHPAIPAFSMDLKMMKCRLGNPGQNVVAAFPVPRELMSEKFGRNRWVNPTAKNGNGRTSMVVKRSLPACLSRGERNVRNEIEILRSMADYKPHPNLPVLMYHDLAYDEFAISPYGYPLSPGEYKIDWRKVLLNVLEALKWLHDHGIIHRDVRWDNVIWDKDHAVLIDLGSAIQITSEEYLAAAEWVTYDGGYICCPQEVIGDFHQPYVPCAAHDCYAFVQLVSMLLWPAFWSGINTRQVANADTTEAAKLRAFWAGMQTSTYFGKYMDAAKEAKYDVLAQMTELCVYF